jgi:hypothetical protein
MCKKIDMIIFMLAVSVGEAAYFQSYQGQMHSYSEVYSEDADYYDGPYSDDDYSRSWALTNEYAEVYDAYAGAVNEGWDANDPLKKSLCIRMNSYSNAYAKDSQCNSYGNGYISTENSQTYGLFYRIKPEAGEKNGDDVMVFGSLAIKVVTDGNSYTYIGGPVNNTFMAVTKNLQPPIKTNPSDSFVVWKLYNIELQDESYDDYYVIGPFWAKIGDLVGIFAENYTDVTGYGKLDNYVESDFTLILTLNRVLKGDLDVNGKVDFSDFAIFAENWLKQTI